MMMTMIMVVYGDDDDKDNVGYGDDDDKDSWAVKLRG